LGAAVKGTEVDEIPSNRPNVAERRLPYDTFSRSNPQEKRLGALNLSNGRSSSAGKWPETAQGRGAPSGAGDSEFPAGKLSLPLDRQSSIKSGYRGGALAVVARHSGNRGAMARRRISSGHPQCMIATYQECGPDDFECLG
jgi:hypothetical protein